MTRTLYVTDLDGTLLDARGALSPQATTTLEDLAARGVLITCATARSWTTASCVIGDLINQPVIVHNGGATVDPSTGHFLDCHYLETSVVDTVIDVCASLNISPLIHTVDHHRELTAWLDKHPSDALLSYWADRRGDPRDSPRRSIEELPRVGVLGAAVLTSRETIEQIGAMLRQSLGTTRSVMVRADTYRSGTGWVEVIAAEASKGAGVLAVAERTGADRIVVFGDDVNDESMFEIADESYAVANAIGALRARASGVIGSNADDAVVQWLRRYACESFTPCD